MYNLMTAAHEISCALQLTVTVCDCLDTFQEVHRDSKEKEATSFSHVLPHFISFSMAELMN